MLASTLPFVSERFVTSFNKSYVQVTVFAGIVTAPTVSAGTAFVAMRSLVS